MPSGLFFPLSQRSHLYLRIYFILNKTLCCR